MARATWALVGLPCILLGCGSDTGIPPDSSKPDAPIAEENTLSLCTDGKDNDGDDQTDCADDDCAQLLACQPKPDAAPPVPEATPALCTDSKDNDGDGRTDCEDSDCLALIVCLDAGLPDGGQADLPPTDASPKDAAVDSLQPADAPQDAPADAPLSDAPPADAPAPDLPVTGCSNHCDCPQGWFCYKGTCVQDPKMGVYCCAKAGCPPGKLCLDLAGQKSTCFEDPNYTCQTACDCGPAHCCVSGKCVKDTNDPWLPGGTAIGGLSCNVGVAPTYCCTDAACYEGRAAYNAQGQLDYFRCWDSSTGQIDTACGGSPCLGTACDCDDGEVCVDTTSKPAQPPGATCHLNLGSSCMSGAAAEALFGWAASDIIPCCKAGCTVGSACDAGWQRLGTMHAYERVVGTCGPCADGEHWNCGKCGDNTCDPGEYPALCPADCTCGDKICAPEEAGKCDQDCGTCGDGNCDPGEPASAYINCQADCETCGDGWCSETEFGSCAPDCWGVCNDAATYKGVFRVCGDGACNIYGDDVETCHTCPEDCASAHWQPMATGTKETLYGVWGTSSTDVFAVGSDGIILRYDGSTWTAMETGTTASFRGVWGSSSTDIYAVGAYQAPGTSRLAGTVYHYDGASWQEVHTTFRYLRGVWGSGPSDVFGVGYEGTITHYDGKDWQQTSGGYWYSIHAVWGSSATNVFVVGSDVAVTYSGHIERFDGSTWQQVTSDATTDLYGVWGSGSKDVFAVGGNDPVKILRYQGNGFKSMSSPAASFLFGVWGSSPTDVYAVGDVVVTGEGRRGLILHYDGSAWSQMDEQCAHWQAVWGASASEVFVVGTWGTIVRYCPNGICP